MTQRSRLGLIALVVVVAVVGFVIANSGGSSTKTTTGPVHIRVVGGKPAGGIKDIVVKKGDPARFSVTSDVADEIHVHGYDRLGDVKAGGSVRFEFPAKIEGLFVVELEQRGEQIAQLRVNPS